MHWTLQLLFAVAVFCFWRWGYPFALAWQEQFQLFLFDGGYLAERLAVPGGVAAYVAEFLVQFYNLPLLGAGVVALLYLLLQVVVWGVMKRSCPLSGTWRDVWFVLSFLPSLLLWLMMGDENLMLAFPVSLVTVLAAMLLCPQGRRARMVYILLAVPVVYWVAGPTVLVLSLLVAVREGRDARSWWRGAVTGIVSVGYALACVWLSAGFEPYPLRRLAAGIFYYRFPEILPYSLPLLALLCLLLAGLPAFVKGGLQGKGPRWLAGGLALVLAGGACLVPQGYDAKKYELMEYDGLVRMGRWNDIVRKAERQQPDLPMSVCAVNLALGMTGQLGERAFCFFQKGTEGLLPKFERDYNSTPLTGEVYFLLGLVNTAQRYAFEAMEAIPDYNKSGRLTKRLAETNLINGEYRVAERYLRRLEKTVFYRKWAQVRLEMIADTGRIERHPVYGPLRKRRLTEDFLFSETEVDKICGRLLMHDKENRLAMQYLLVYPLLNRDVESFMNYFGYVNSLVRYNPTVCQEAVAFAYMQRGMQVPAGAVGDGVMRRFRSFAQVYTTEGKESRQLESFRNTLWYYLMKEQ